VSSQADTQLADLEIERREMKKNPNLKISLELRDIYMARSPDEALALQVAAQLMQRDTLACMRAMNQA
jgi:VIT1/CCC1 family predicted Fe2+/Mn2+ transporter